MPCHCPHASIVLNESDMLATIVDSKRPVYVDTDYLSVAHVAAVSR